MQVETADGVMQVRFWSLAFQQVEFGYETKPLLTKSIYLNPCLNLYLNLYLNLC